MVTSKSAVFGSKAAVFWLLYLFFGWAMIYLMMLLALMFQASFLRGEETLRGDVTLQCKEMQCKEIRGEQASAFCKPLTLSELVSIALENNNATKEAWLRAQRAAAIVGKSKASFCPRLDFNADVRHGRDFKYQQGGPSVNYTIVDAEFILRMILLDQGERSFAVKEAQMALLAAGWHTDFTMQEVILSVLENGYLLFYAQEAFKAACISRDDAKKALSFAIELNKAGMSPITDIYISKATLAQMEIEVLERKAAMDIQRAKLATSMGLSAEECIQLSPLPLDSLKPNDLPESTCELIDYALKQRSDLLAKQARLQEALAKEDYTRAKYLPKVSFLGRGGFEQALHNKAKSGHYELRLSFDAPLFTGFEATFEQRRAYNDVQLSLVELSQMHMTIALQVLTHSRNLAAIGNMLKFAKENLENASLAYQGTIEKYKVGKEGIIELSNTLRQLAHARLRHSEIITRYFTARANLAYATGTL